MEYEIYEINAGQWGYRGIGFIQEWNPEQSGYVPMSREQAEQFASGYRSPTTVSAKSISKLEFMDRFTEGELVAIYTAAKQSVQIEVWLEKLKMTTGDINLLDPRTIAGVQTLEAIGLIAPGRSLEILG